jgi:hypothetical protein
MKRQGLQDMVKSIFSDTEIRSQFSRDPQSVIASYKLTAAEKKAVLTTRMKLAPAAGDSTCLSTDGALESWF